MKIFRIDRDIADWPEEAATALLSPEAAPLGVLPARLVADSAVIRNNRPVFIPDFARERWMVDVRPAVHIGRLGKFISRRFAERYVEGFSLVACVRPDGGSLPDALTDSFDGAVTVGEMIPVPDNGQVTLRVAYTPLPVRGGRQDAVTEEKSVEIDMQTLRISDTVALLSRYATLKSGDLILPASVGLTFPVRLDYSLTGEVDGRVVLSLRVK